MASSPDKAGEKPGNGRCPADGAGGEMPSPGATAERGRYAALLQAGALEMHYQPLLNLKTGDVEQAEALARLRDGERLLAPGLFLPALSPEDLLELYARGLRQALAQRRLWRALGCDIALSVNLPASALGNDRYFDATRDALAAHDCPPHRLTLEILETEEMPAGAGPRCTRLKALGVGLAEDDLGSGHSNLRRLRELPFDTVKIDRSIVMPGERDACNVLQRIYQLTRLGHALGKTVVAEGVESADMLEATALLGVDAAQGHAVARPMAAPRLAAWMRAYAAGAAVAPRARPGGALARLARLLIWEEEMRRACATRSRGGPAVLQRAPSMQRLLSEAHALFAAFDVPACQALIAIAVAQGIGSDAYNRARKRVEASLLASRTRV